MGEREHSSPDIFDISIGHFYIEFSIYGENANSKNIVIKSEKLLKK
jgi:hypothetical protein